MRLYRSLLRRYRPESFDHTRRAFLGLGVAAGALALTGPTNAALGLPSRTHHGRRVIVAGAGFAGLACAYELKRAGYDVQILEARPRIGGRVLTIRNWLPGKMVEAGGELIGSNHPMWLRYAHLFGLGFRPVTDWPEENRPILIDGRRLDDAAKRALFEDMDRILGALTRQSRGVDAEKPWLTLDAEALDRGSFGDWLALQRPEPLTERVMQIELGADNGVSLAQQSLLGMMTQIKGGGLEKYWTDSEMLRCRQGNDALAAAFAGAVGGKRIHLQTQVKKIDITGNAVALVDVTGTRWQADHVVLAIPPSVWHAVAIQPALPATLFPQMGVNYKYLARIRKEVWAPASPEGLAEDSISETWNSVDNQSGPGLCLTGFTGGPPAVRGRERYAAEGSRVFIDAISALFPAFSQAFVEGRFIDWPRDPFVMAGYSSAAPGQITAIGSTLYGGIGRPQFAGEHSCYAFPGYMEGALQSGVRAARNIARIDGV